MTRNNDTVDGTLRGQPLRGQNGDFEKSFCGPLRGHPGTLRGQNGDFEKSFHGTLRGQIKTYRFFRQSDNDFT